MEIFEPTEHYIQGIIRHLPSNAGKFDPLGGCSRHHFERLSSNEAPGFDTN